MTNFSVAIADWTSDKNDLSRVRFEVFVEEQGVPAEIELDELDASCVHAAARNGVGDVIGTARLILNVQQPDQTARIGRMAVLKQWRGTGVGAALLQTLVKEAQRQGATAILLHAQTHATPFYAKLGFTVQGEEYEEAGIPHRYMLMTL